MTIDGNMDYASARIHARFAQLPDEATWRRIESSRDLPHYLNSARASPLADWVATLDLSHDSHAIERALRAQWSHHVRHVAVWHPRSWQPWIAWIAWLPTLSLLADLARTDAAPAWMSADPAYGSIVPGSFSERAAALSRMGLAPLGAAFLNHTSLLTAWVAHWQALLPKTSAHTQQLFRLLLRTLQQYEQEMQRATDSGDTQHARLVERLSRLLRNGVGTVIASVSYLGLLALHLERLRGGLVRRRLLPAAAGVAH